MSGVSIVIPVYKARRYLRRAVGSALAQPETAEVLLIEDGSDDGSLELCHELAAADRRVRVLQHPDGGNRGAAAARNLGLEAATGAYLAFLDADDYYLPGRFTRAMELLRDPGVDGVHEAIGVACEDDAARRQFEEVRGSQLRQSPAGPLTSFTPGIPPGDLFMRLVSMRALFCHLNALTLRRELALRCRFLPALRLHQDLHYVIRITYYGRLAAGRLDTPVAMRWVHADNRISRAVRDVSRPYQQALVHDLWRWGLDEGLPGRYFLALYRRWRRAHEVKLPTLPERHPLNRLLNLPVYLALFVLALAREPRGVLRMLGRIAS